MNIQIEKIHQELISIINNSQLPAGVIYYIFKDCLNEITKEYERILSQEQQKSIEEQSTPHKLQPDEVEEI